MSTLSKVLLGLVFLASLGFLWAASRAVMTWDAYRSAYNAHVARVEQVEQNIERVRNGDPNQMSIAELKAAQSVIYYRRGRVWTGCRALSYDPNTGIVKLRTGLPDPPELAVGTVVQAFESADSLPLGNRIYIGEFKVVASAPPDANAQTANVDLEWTHKFTLNDLRNQAQRLQGLDTNALQGAIGRGDLNAIGTEVLSLRDALANNAQLTPEAKSTLDFELGQLAFMVREMQRISRNLESWVLYEVMPDDTHVRFAELTDEDIEAMFPPANPAVMTDADQQRVEEIRRRLIDQYVRHGDEPSDEDDTSSILVRVRFTKDFGDPSVNKEELAKLHIVDYTNQQDTHIPADVTRLVAKDREAWVTAAVADQLKAMGLVDELERKFHRPLRDYALMFSEFYRESPLLDDRIRATLADRDATLAAAALAEAQNVKLAQYQQALQAEHDLLAKEAQEVTEHLNQLTEQVNAVQQQIETLEKQNLEWAAKLAAVQTELLKKIEAAASAQASSQ